MPIKDKSVYPADWAEISIATRERAGQKCETCGVSNHAVGYREKDGTFVRLAADKDSVGLIADAAELDGFHVISIVLTVAHLNNDPGDCRPENLKALCQRCHNRLDAPMRARHAAETRRRKATERGQMELPEVHA
jgi:hypothetical protein